MGFIGSVNDVGCSGRFLPIRKLFGKKVEEKTGKKEPFSQQRPFHFFLSLLSPRKSSHSFACFTTQGSFTRTLRNLLNHLLYVKIRVSFGVRATVGKVQCRKESENGKNETNWKVFCPHLPSRVRQKQKHLPSPSFVFLGSLRRHCSFAHSSIFSLKKDSLLLLFMH